MSLSYLMPVVNLDNGCDGSVLVDLSNVKVYRFNLLIFTSFGP
jgi:hypothetical protein